MLRRRRTSQGSPSSTARAFRAFEEVLAAVEEAKAVLASAAPSGRAAGLPLAEALLGFESELSEAMEGMPAWRVGALSREWDASRAGLLEARRRAERLRLGETPEGYEQLYGVLGDLIEPLDALGVALERFRTLGFRP